MSANGFIHLSVACAALSLPGFILPAAAGPIYSPGALNFQTSGQSMWGSGGAAIIDKSLFLGTEWNTPTARLGLIVGDSDTVIVPGVGSRRITIPCASIPVVGGCFPGTGISFTTPAIPPVTADTRSGAEVSAQTSGKIGLNLGLKADSGSVNAALAFDTTLELPETFAAGSFFNLNPQSALAGHSQFTTNFPEVSAKVDAVLGIKATLGGTGCAPPFGCESGQTTIGFDPVTQEIVSFNQNGDGAVRVFGLDGLTPDLPFAFGEEIKLPPSNPLANVGDVTVHLPNIDTVGQVAGGALSSAGGDDLLDLRADLDGLALLSFGLPTVLEAEIPISAFNVGYNLLDVELGPTMEILQEFLLAPTLMTTLTFDRPVEAFGFGQVTSLTTPWDLLPDIQLVDGAPVSVTPEFFVDARLRNQTRLGVDGVFTVEALKASFGFSAFGLSYDVGSLGPVFSFEERGDLFESPNIIDSTFDLEGFNRILGPSFMLGIDADDLPDTFVELVTASPATLEQAVHTPDQAFELAFDFWFYSGVGELLVKLGDLVLGTLLASDYANDGFLTHTFAIADGYLDMDLLLSFVFDGPAGSVLRLDDIRFLAADGGQGLPGVVNGDFQVLGDALNGWTGGGDGHLRISTAPEPGSFLLFAAGLLFLLGARRRLALA